MTVSMKTLRFGIEIETVRLTRDALARAIHSVVGETVTSEYGNSSWQVVDLHGRTWRVVHDGSLSGGTYSGEIVSPILTWWNRSPSRPVVTTMWTVACLGGNSHWDAADRGRGRTCELGTQVASRTQPYVNYRGGTEGTTVLTHTRIATPTRFAVVGSLALERN